MLLLVVYSALYQVNIILPSWYLIASICFAIADIVNIGIKIGERI